MVHVAVLPLSQQKVNENVHPNVDGIALDRVGTSGGITAIAKPAALHDAP